MTERNDVHTKATVVILQSSDIVEEQQNYVLPDDEIDENQLQEKNKMYEVKHKLKLTTTQRTVSLNYNNFTKPHRG